MAPVSDTLHRQEETVTGPKKQPLYRQIQNRLRDDIIAGTYGISEKLPSEHDLMDMFGASRVTVRRALTGLQEDGLIVSRRGEGYFVTRPAVYRIWGGCRASSSRV